MAGGGAKGGYVLEYDPKKQGGDGEEDDNDDDDRLHCLCRLPAGAARFRTLITCDTCHRWFHPACVKMKVTGSVGRVHRRAVDDFYFIFGAGGMGGIYTSLTRCPSANLASRKLTHGAWVTIVKRLTPILTGGSSKHACMATGIVVHVSLVFLSCCLVTLE